MSLRHCQAKIGFKNSPTRQLKAEGKVLGAPERISKALNLLHLHFPSKNRFSANANLN